MWGKTVTQGSGTAQYGEKQGEGRAQCVLGLLWYGGEGKEGSGEETWGQGLLILALDGTTGLNVLATEPEPRYLSG